MKSRLATAICTCVLATAGAGVASAAPPDAAHATGALGFHSVEAPIGLRWWLPGQKVGIDVGLGFNSGPSEIDVDENESGWAFEAGVPFVAHSWDRLHLLVRPGLLYESQQVGFDADPGPGFDFDTENETTMSLMLELEAEVFLHDNFSVSASHGLAIERFSPAFDDDDDTRTSFGTVGNNFTNIGFHVYFFGGGR
jgi:hypothetical protein